MIDLSTIFLDRDERFADVFGTLVHGVPHRAVTNGFAMVAVADPDVSVEESPRPRGRVLELALPQVRNCDIAALRAWLAREAPGDHVTEEHVCITCGGDGDVWCALCDRGSNCRDCGGSGTSSIPTGIIRTVAAPAVAGRIYGIPCNLRLVNEALRALPDAIVRVDTKSGTDPIVFRGEDVIVGVMPYRHDAADAPSFSEVVS